MNNMERLGCKDCMHQISETRCRKYSELGKVDNCHDRLSMEEYERQREREAEAMKMAEAIANFANNYNSPNRELAMAIMLQHRTIQQSIFEMFLFVIHEWSLRTEYGKHDLRNEYTVKKSAEIMKLLDGFYRCPCI